MSDGIVRVATYTRISTDETNQPYSLDAQASSLAKFIESQPGYVHAASYTDQMSGAKLERPGLQKMLKDAEDGKFDLILVYRLDRLARSIELVHQVFKRLAVPEVSLRSATESFDTATAGGKLMLNILATFAQFERDVLIDRIKSGISQKAQRGQWVGGPPPFGYRLEGRKNLVIVSGEAPIVREAFRLVDEEQIGANQIAERLNLAGHRSRGGKLFTFKTVLDMLRRPVYAGWIAHRDLAYPGAHEPIVSIEQFDRVQGVLDGRGDRSARQVSSEYLLTGLAQCGICGTGLVGVSGTGRSGQKYRY